MARIPQVTRTIKTTDVTLLCMDIEKCEPFNETITLARTYKNDDEILKQAKKIVETGTIKVVHVVDKEEIETLYGMTEQEFIKVAKKLPPRGTKETEENETE